jgi:hypothetical protein
MPETKAQKKRKKDEKDRKLAAKRNIQLSKSLLSLSTSKEDTITENRKNSDKSSKSMTIMNVMEETSLSEFEGFSTSEATSDAMSSTPIKEDMKLVKHAVSFFVDLSVEEKAAKSDEEPVKVGINVSTETTSSNETTEVTMETLHTNMLDLAKTLKEMRTEMRTT